LKAWNGEPGSTLIETGAPVIAACFAGSVYIAKRTFGRGRQDDRLGNDGSHGTLASSSESGDTGQCTLVPQRRPAYRTESKIQIARAMGFRAACLRAAADSIGFLNSAWSASSATRARQREVAGWQYLP
jgi:hypothetical protein